MRTCRGNRPCSKRSLLVPGSAQKGGTKNVQNKTGETVSSLHDQLGLVKGFKAPKDHYFQRAESFYNVATYMDETGYLDGYGRKSLHQRSHGEWFVTLLTTKFRGKGLYPFDDPKAALPPSRQLAALSAIHQLVADDSQFIVATHSPALLSCPRAKLVLLDGTGINGVSYEDTEAPRGNARLSEQLSPSPRNALFSDEDDA